MEPCILLHENCSGETTLYLINNYFMEIFSNYLLLKFTTNCHKVVCLLLF